MAVTEALELQDGLRAQLNRTLAAVIVNGLLPQRFTAAELRRIAAVVRDRLSMDTWRILNQLHQDLRLRNGNVPAIVRRRVDGRSKPGGRQRLPP